MARTTTITFDQVAAAANAIKAAGEKPTARREEEFRLMPHAPQSHAQKILRNHSERFGEKP